MTYAVPTAAEFKVRFPVFAAVDNAVVTTAITYAATRVNSNWEDADAVEGINLYTAHTLTLDGLGAGSEAVDIAGGLAGVQSYSSGTFSVNRGDVAKAQATSSLDATSFGRRYRQLLKNNIPGVAVA